MKRHIGLLMIVLLLLAFALPSAAQEEGPLVSGWRPDAPSLAHPGRYAVGTREYVIETEDRDLPLRVWYPALNPDRTDNVIQYDIALMTSRIPMIITGRAIRDAAPNVENDPYPLVVFSHGFFMYREQSTFLTEHLASRGFVVFSVDHVGSSSTTVEWTVEDFARARFEMAITRPQDASYQIDYAETLTASGGDLEGLIDVEHVAVIGHSAGGQTALEAGGAQINPASQSAWCTELKANQAIAMQSGRLSANSAAVMIASADCDYGERMWPQVATLAGLQEVPAGLWPSLGDDRVDAIVSLDGPIYLFGAEGAADMTVPVLIMAVDADDFLADFALDEFFSNLASPRKAVMTFQSAGHYIFVDSYSRYPASAWNDLWPNWSDPVWDMDRAHDLINHFTTAFLLDVLKGDEAAHAALAPDTVSFPGITYEAEGF